MIRPFLICINTSINTAAGESMPDSCIYTVVGKSLPYATVWVLSPLVRPHLNITTPLLASSKPAAADVMNYVIYLDLSILNYFS
jgi:hypothetical protein